MSARHSDALLRPIPSPCFVLATSPLNPVRLVTVIRLLHILLLAPAFALPLAAEAPDVFAFVEKSCVGCHNSRLKSGDVDLQALQNEKTFAEDREIWEKVVEKLQTGKMPPPGTPQPPAATTSA